VWDIDSAWYRDLHSNVKNVSISFNNKKRGLSVTSKISHSSISFLAGCIQWWSKSFKIKSFIINLLFKIVSLRI